MSLYDKASRGLTIHLRHIHIDLDPTSPRYLTHLEYDGDTPDEKGRHVLGAQRTPTGRKARAAFLWRPLKVEGWNAMAGDIKELIVELFELAGEQIDRTEQVMLEPGRQLHQISVGKKLAAENNNDEDHDEDAAIYTMPLFQQTASIYYQLACRIPYLRQVQSLLTACNVPSLSEEGDTVCLADVLSELRSDLVNRPYMPLDEAVRQGRSCKEQGDTIMRESKPDYCQALAMYIRSIKHILSWFPSEFYMAPWEARSNGVGPLLVRSNINIAIALMRGFGLYTSAFHILDSVSQLLCVTNWEKAKISHLQARCVGRVIQGAPVDECEWEVHPEPLTRDILSYSSARNQYLDGRRGEFANRAWTNDFSPDSFAAHYEKLQSRLGPQPTPWWCMENTAASANMRRWIAGQLDWLKGVTIIERRDGPDDAGTLEADNRRRQMGYMPRWEYEL